MTTRKQDPTPAELQERKKEVQNNWTEDERRKRLGIEKNEEPWLPPVVAATHRMREIETDAEVGH